MVVNPGTARPKHIPERSCVVCRTKRPKRELTRVVRTTEGTVAIDPTGRMNGRGAYVCREASCWSDNAFRPRLRAALKTEITDNASRTLADYARATFVSDARGPAAPGKPEIVRA